MFGRTGIDLLRDRNVHHRPPAFAHCPLRPRSTSVYDDSGETHSDDSQSWSSKRSAWEIGIGIFPTFNLITSAALGHVCSWYSPRPSGEAARSAGTLFMAYTAGVAVQRMFPCRSPPPPPPLPRSCSSSRCRSQAQPPSLLPCLRRSSVPRRLTCQRNKDLHPPLLRFGSGLPEA